jgi:hypothetical protein
MFTIFWTSIKFLINTLKFYFIIYLFIFSLIFIHKLIALDLLREGKQNRIQ